jgi:choice-of-anchor A domain-containing protein
MSSKASLDGQLYVGGDATISHATIGNTLPVSLGSRNDLVVNGALNYHSGHVVSGNVYFGAGSSVGSVVVNGLSEGAYASEGTGVFDFASATDCYLEQTEVYCGLNQTGYHETHFRDMLFTAVEMSSDDYAVFHATCEDLADKVSFDFSMKSSHQTAVVNVYGGGESCSFNANVNYHPSKVLFNFCDTPELHVRGSTSGSILAPGADIIGEELSMTGQLIGKSFSGNLNSQSHALFDGCLPLFR